MTNEWRDVPLFPTYGGLELIDCIRDLPASLKLPVNNDEDELSDTEFDRRADLVDDIVRLVNLPKLLEFLRIAGLSEEKINELATLGKIKLNKPCISITVNVVPQTPKIIRNSTDSSEIKL